MRYLYLLLIPLLSPCVRAQSTDDSTVDLGNDTLTLFSTYAWRETSDTDKAGYLLVLSPEGNFDEDATSDTARLYRHLLGRWTYDPPTQQLRLAVDGLMGRGLVHSRYRAGRDYYLPYELLQLDDQTLILRDVLTGDLRHFEAINLEHAEDQAVKRIPKAKRDTTVTSFKLPKLGGQ